MLKRHSFVNYKAKSTSGENNDCVSKRKLNFTFTLSAITFFENGFTILDANVSFSTFKLLLYIITERIVI